MSKIKIEIRYGYGIERLEEELDFNASSDNLHNDTHIIYAQNGIMKSSFTKTLLSKDSVKDYIRNKKGSCSVLVDNSELAQENILAVPSFDNSALAKNERLHLLLADQRLRDEYEELMSNRTAALFELIGELRNKSGLKSNTSFEEIIAQFCLTFGDNTPKNDRSFVHLIRSSIDQIHEARDFVVDLPYAIAGESYVKDFAETNRDFLDEFIARYDKVLETAAYMRGGFDTKGAEEVGKILDESKFFNAKHSVTLLDLRDPNNPLTTKVDNAKSLTNLLQSDFDRVFEDNPALKTKFKRALKTLNQKNRADFKKMLENTHTRQILLLMRNPSQIKRQLWYGYLKACEPYLSNLLEKDEEITEKLQDIANRASKSKTKWDNVINKFNNRFKHMPFELEVNNRSDILLDGVEKLDLIYRYRMPDGTKYPVENDEKLRGCLSTGERKAFYLLDLLFEIELRIASGKNHLIVLDDVVDSFDYKNKYAFLEYINELSSKHSNLKLIILTHNFDFFRLMQSRLFGDKNRTHSWFAERETHRTKFVQAGNFNYFCNTKNRALEHEEAYLSLIPFSRNLIEYGSNDPSNDAGFKTLTQCLHALSLADPPITFADIKNIIKIKTSISGCNKFSDSDSIHAKIVSTADSLPPVDQFNMLHNKTILAMAIRLKAEGFMIGKLPVAEVLRIRSIEKNFTRELYEAYLALPGYNSTIATTLEDVNLITPEHIHINAFMYEPLIDLSQEELSDLYKEVKALK